MCVCVLLCVCVCVLLCLYVCLCVGGDAPLACPLLSDEGFLKKRGMPARCTSVGVMLGVGAGVGVRVCAL